MKDGSAGLFAARCVYGLFLGAVLFYAVLELLIALGGARVFRYQGF